MNIIDYEIADNFCLEALEGLSSANDIKVWLTQNESLFQSINTQPIGLPGIANSNFEGVRYEHIAKFHSVYIKKLFEQNILNELTQEQAVLYFIKNMNIEKLNEILDYREYQDHEKPQFLKLLSAAFDTFKSRGNTKLITSEGKCTACKLGHKAYYLKGDLDDSHLEILIEIVNDRVCDIFECNSFKCDSGMKVDFKKRIYINKGKYG